MTQTSTTIPGSGATVSFERGEQGQLLQLTCNGRTYFEQCGQERVLDGGFVTISEALAGRRLLRHVRAGGASWVEEYRWDDGDRLVHVDGVDVARDAANRVVACQADSVVWRYGYRDHHLVRIEREDETRRLRRAPDGRLTALRRDLALTEVAYDGAGRRCDVPVLPERYHRDALGRLWTVTDEDGSIVATYLWDGYACLGRIDGAPGEPLAAAFSLDPTCTPVRVISRDGVRRIPRDAYGESLLGVEGVPGLYGGTLFGGFCHYAARALDPRTGSFDRPDPLDGLADDPRRAEGFRGPLAVEHPAAGPYAVAQHDPVGRADPTGEFSYWILLSDLTWGFQNNMVGWLGMDFIFNFWGSLFTGNIGRFFDFQGISSDRVNQWGVRRDGLINVLTGGRAFAFAHQIWSPRSEFDKLTHARVFDPRGAFRPTLLGTMLRAVPKTGDPFLLNGDARFSAGLGLPDWSRAGGQGEAVMPGSLVPHFPSGGLHFDTRRQDILCPMDCTVTEIESGAGLIGGTVTDRAIVAVPKTGLGLSANDLVVLSDASGSAFIETVAGAPEAGGKTRVFLRSDVAALAASGVRLRGLGAVVSTENLSHGAGTPPAYLSVTGSAGAYRPGDPLRLSQGAGPIGAVIIDHLEARVQIDAALTGLNRPLTVRTAQAIQPSRPATLVADASTVDSAAPPNVNDAVVVSNAAGTASLAVIVTGRTGNQWRTDRPVRPLLGAEGDAVTFRILTPGAAQIGTKTDALDAGAELTYRPAQPRTAPSANFVLVRDSGGKLAIRAVTGLTYDALVLAVPLPGNAANPYSVERFATRPPDETGLSLTRAQALLPDTPLANDTVALQLSQYAGAAFVAGTVVTDSAAAPPAPATFVVAGNVARLAVTPAMTLTGLDRLGPSRIIGLQPAAGAMVPALARRVRVTVTLDRVLPLGASLEAVPLGIAGPAYDARPRAVPGGSAAVATLTVLPTTSIPGTPNAPVQMPRFRAGELVAVDYGGGNGRLYRIGAAAPADPVKAVEGTTLGLLGDAAPPAPLPAAATVTRLDAVPPNPRTGSSRIGVRGTPAAAGGANQVTFDVWQADGLVAGNAIGIVDTAAGLTHPAFITAIDAVEIEFAPKAPVANGNVTVAGDGPVRGGTAASITLDGPTVIIPGNPVTAGPDFVLAVPFKSSAVAANGSLSGGTVIVPDDDQDGELTRLDSLITHELTHTRQWQTVGPLMLFCFPTFIVEGLVEWQTDVELPRFSAYVPCTLVTEGGNRFLRIPDTQGIPFATDEHVQLSWAAAQPGGNVAGAGVGHSLKLGPARADGTFRITVGVDIVPAGVVNAQVRRAANDTDWGTFLEWAHQLSAGGIMNTAGGFVYGGLYNLIGRGIYALRRLLGGQGKTHDATVEGAGDEAGTLLRLAGDDGREALDDASRIIIQSGDTVLVRDVASFDAGVIRLSVAISLTGPVQVAPYEIKTPDSFWDWNDYFPASVPDPARPASIRIEAVGGDSIGLQPFDRITISAGSRSFRRTVTAVAAGGVVELDEAVPGGEPLFRVARIGSEDPIGSLDAIDSTRGLGSVDWLRWAFDPYAQLHYRLRPEPGSFWETVARIARYGFSSSSWSFVVLSVLMVDRVFQAEHLSRIEQEASSESGDNYSPLGRQRGKLSIVGDVARYWQEPTGGTRDTDTTIAPGMQDAGGVWLVDVPRVVPSGAVGAVATAEPNGTFGIPAALADPGRQVPDAFFAKAAANVVGPPAITLTAPAPGYQPANRGWVPTSPTLQRASGLYAAFTRPGTHRLTVVNGVFQAQQGREAQEKGRQTLFFDRAVGDVTVTANGQPVAEGSTLQVVQRQQVRLRVIPNGTRRYAATLLRPENGDILRAPDARDPLLIATRAANGIETVEISRVHRFDPAARTFDNPVLQKHGVHVPGDIHIPVRRFSVQVVDTLPLRNAVSLDSAAVIASLARNAEGFILVPAAIGPQGLRITSATAVAGGAAVPLGQLAGLIQPPPAAMPDDVRAFIGDGALFRLVFGAGIVLPGATLVRLTVQVGAAAPMVLLTVDVTLTP